VLHAASIWGREGGGLMSYNAAKAALISLAHEQARELAPRGVRVLSIAPGSTLHAGGAWEDRLRRDPTGVAEFVRREIPFGRFGTAEEVGDIIAFLASPRASWVGGPASRSPAASRGQSDVDGVRLERLAVEVPDLDAWIERFEAVLGPGFVRRSVRQATGTVDVAIHSAGVELLAKPAAEPRLRSAGAAGQLAAARRQPQGRRSRRSACSTNSRTMSAAGWTARTDATDSPA
jgi:NAD(P)-dependent dehydrogenase (short-subunit alcohol dehydrogenase family)